MKNRYYFMIIALSFAIVIGVGVLTNRQAQAQAQPKELALEGLNNSVSLVDEMCYDGVVYLKRSNGSLTIKFGRDSKVIPCRVRPL